VGNVIAIQSIIKLEIQPVLLAIIPANNVQVQVPQFVQVVMLLNFEQMTELVAVNVWINIITPELMNNVLFAIINA